METALGVTRVCVYAIRQGAHVKQGHRAEEVDLFETSEPEAHGRVETPRRMRHRLHIVTGASSWPVRASISGVALKI